MVMHVVKIALFWVHSHIPFSSVQFRIARCRMGGRFQLGGCCTLLFLQRLHQHGCLYSNETRMVICFQTSLEFLLCKISVFSNRIQSLYCILQFGRADVLKEAGFNGAARCFSCMAWTDLNSMAVCLDSVCCTDEIRRWFCVCFFGCSNCWRHRVCKMIGFDNLLSSSFCACTDLTKRKDLEEVCSRDSWDIDPDPQICPDRIRAICFVLRFFSVRKVPATVHNTANGRGFWEWY